MVDHSEFPWGPQYEPGLLTPMGVLGWVVAAALLLALLVTARNAGGGERRRKGDDAQLTEIYTTVLTAARYALKQDEFGILRGADVLRRVVKSHLGGVLLAGGGLGKHLKALGETMGEGEKKSGKHDKPHKDHGGGKHEPHPQPAAPSTVAETVHGHSITLNIGADVLEKPAHDTAHGHGDHGHDDHETPPSLENQLLLVRKAVRDFEAWWSDRPARISELRAARDDLTLPRKPDPALSALLEEKK